MGNSPTHLWKRLNDSPFGDKHCGRNPIVINNKIILSPELNNKLYTFDINATTWNQDEFNQDNNIWYHSLCPSNDGKHMFLYDGHNANVLLIIDIKTKMVIKTIKKIKKTGIWPSMIIDPEFDNILHIIGGSNNNSHLTININNGNMKTVHTFNEVKRALCGGAIIYLRTKNIALLFHGDISVYLYEFKYRKWKNTKIKFPMEGCKQFGYVMTKDNKYILIFGGGLRNHSRWIFSNDIFIFDVDQMLFEKSKVKCPKLYNMNAAITRSGDIHLFNRQYHWIKHIGDILPEYGTKKEWTCSVCTFLNVSKHELCIMCNIGKHPDIDSNDHDVNKPISEKEKEEENKVEMELYGSNNNDFEAVKNWLKNEVKLPQYIPLFIVEGYDDMITIETMTDRDLIDIGVKKKGHRKKLMLFINKYKKSNNNDNGIGEIEGVNIVDTIY